MYTITINTNKKKAEAIFKFLKAFDVDFNIIDLNDEIEILPELSAKEYKKRYKYTLEHLGEGLTINEMESKIYPNEKV